MTAERRLQLMGTEVRIVASRAGADAVEALLRDYDRRLSRFRPGSELCRLNADAREKVPVSALLGDAVAVALAAAERTCGLVDPTLLPELEGAGYSASWTAEQGVPLSSALAELPPAEPGTPRPDGRWRSIRVDPRYGTISRPPGLRLDIGGTGRGHAADLAAALLEHEPTWAVGCGEDLRVGGKARRARAVRIADPFRRGTLLTLRATHGAFATSGIGARTWRDDNGHVAHHILNPATGRPAFSGLVTVTALAPTAAQAAALAKAALLSGPSRARSILALHGGVTVDADRRAELIGPLESAPTARLSTPRPVSARRAA